jgi:hypothetical protein
VTGTLTLLLSTAATAGPYPPTPGCAISAPTGSFTAGGTVDLVGSGFPANAVVALSINAGQTGSLGSVRTGATGSFTDEVTLPAPMNSTEHRIAATSGRTACSLGFAIAGPPANVATSGGLASTGYPVLSSVIIGLLLVAGGGLLLLAVVVRRRRV